jgi:hypothetical protein
MSTYAKVISRSVPCRLCGVTLTSGLKWRSKFVHKDGCGWISMLFKTQQDPINGIPKRTRGSGCPCQTSGRSGCNCPGLMAQSTQLSQGKWMKMGDDLLLFFLLATKPISTQFSWNNHGHFTCGFINLKRARDLPYSPPNHGLPFWRNVVFRSQIFKQSWPENNSSFLKKNYLRKLTKDLSLKNLVVFVPNL